MRRVRTSIAVVAVIAEAVVTAEAVVIAEAVVVAADDRRASREPRRLHPLDT
jgi:hypothetical protein